MPFTQLAIRKAFRGIRKRAAGFVLLAILFLAVGFLQDAFVNYQIRRTAMLELNESTDEIADEIYKADKWDLKSYRQAFISVSSWYVFTSDGLLIDNEAPTPELVNLFHSVEVPAGLSFGKLETITSELGEKYRVLAQKIRGGVVVLGVEEPADGKCTECADQELVANLTKLGLTLESAAALSPRELDQDIEYAVISDSGELKSGWGGIPLKVDASAMLAAARAGKPFHAGSQTYLFVSKPILDSKNKIVGTVVIPREITLEQRAMNEQWKFNLALSALAFAVAVVIALYFIGRENSEKSSF
jgi:hypothetical protein